MKSGVVKILACVAMLCTAPVPAAHAVQKNINANGGYCPQGTHPRPGASGAVRDKVADVSKDCIPDQGGKSKEKKK